MKIRMRQTITGTFHNIDAGVARGDIVDIDNDNANRYIKLGLAEPLDKPPVEEHTTITSETVETAVPKPKTAGGRSRAKPPAWHDLDAPGWTNVDPQ
jgi:hypothetical protein